MTVNADTNRLLLAVAAPNDDDHQLMPYLSYSKL